MSVNQKDSLTQKIPARGEFVGVEWEMGYPCARIHHSFSVGSGPGGGNHIQTNAQSIDEVFWFALDKGVVVKMIRTSVRDRRIEGGGGGPIARGASGAPPRR